MRYLDIFPAKLESMNVTDVAKGLVYWTVVPQNAANEDLLLLSKKSSKCKILFCSSLRFRSL